MFITSSQTSWKIGKLGELIEVNYGKDHKKLSAGSIPVFGSGGVMRYVDKAIYDKESVLIPRKGSLNNVLIVENPFWTVDTMFYSKMKRADIAKYVYFFLSRKNLAGMNTGSAVPSMTVDILNNLPIRIPDECTLRRFSSLVNPMFYTINLNNEINYRLSEIRDSLLPRLLSGEIQV